MSCLVTNSMEMAKRTALGVALVVIASAMFSAHTCAAQTMQKGVSVEMARTSNATAMPDADNRGSVILTVADNGNVYLGINPVKPAELAEKIKGSLSKPGQKLYIKADARTPYADVAKVLDAARSAGVEAPILLTSQLESPQPGTVVPPKGLEVRVGPMNSSPVIVQIKADGKLSYGQVVHVIDTCRSTGASVVLVTPGL